MAKVAKLEERHAGYLYDIMLLELAGAATNTRIDVIQSVLEMLHFLKIKFINLLYSVTIFLPLKLFLKKITFTKRININTLIKK